jgi:Trk K+ transport system NAD-binding subunit
VRKQLPPLRQIMLRELRKYVCLFVLGYVTLDTGDILVVLGSSRDIKNFKKEIGVIE